MEGWHGWDEYAPFYDWENTRTIGRQDVPFWRGLARRTGGPVLELGCGTGRVTLPLARAGVPVVGVDRSACMIRRAASRARRLRVGAVPHLVRADIRALPCETAAFPLVMAPYGILQSLLRDADLRSTLDEVARVVRPGGMFGVDLVPDLPVWQEYQQRIRLRGPRGAGGPRGTSTGGRPRAQVTLVESVRQDRRRRLTIFDQEYIERRGAHTARHRFSLTFRTLSVVQMTRRIERAGFHIEAVLGDYDGRSWDRRADVWLIVARRV